jgi:hypothetical protein
MKFEDLYLKGLDRKVNPAVSASDLNEETVNIEIDEYVFTDDIINNLYEILRNIRENHGNHTGIWINGYYGSGKSHFLKYVDYCLSPKYGAKALGRLREAVAERKPMELNVEPGEMDDLIRWYTTRATVDTVMFNIGTVHDANSGENEVFTQVFWNQFNGMRGLNAEHLAMAQFLEKPLADDGKYEEFLDYVKEQGYDWKRNIHRFSGSKLDLALKMAAAVDPSLSTDVIRERIKNNDVNISVESFANELKEYLDHKNNPNYRLLFLVDEISQFIDNRQNVLLQLQEVVSRVCEVCASQVWFACTAQQDLSEVLDNCNIQKTSENYGKIMGRFEVRPSLQGTNPEYITQKRILEKKGEVEIMLKKLYEKDKAKLDAQFILPTSYNSYRNADDFANYYPFVPYQFQLIMKVLDSFVNMNYVDKQVKGNERSLINITFSIARDTAGMEMGQFISFDRFFGAMFQGSMQHLGQRALSNARAALDQVKDEKRDFYQRVVYVLFMVCNLAEEDKQQFSATIDNIVTLLMTKIDDSKAAIKSDVAEVLTYLMDKAVIRKVKTDSGGEVYEFYTEEESKVAQIISNQHVDSNTYSDELYKIFFKHFGEPGNKEPFGTRSFSVGAMIEGRNYLVNNADVYVDFVTTADTDSPEQYALNNPANHLAFFLSPQLKDNQNLNIQFLEYCRVQKFAREPALSEERQRTKQIFQDRAKERYDQEICPQFQHILDTCKVISGQNVLSESEIGMVKAKERYKRALQVHLSLVYSQAKLIDIKKVPQTNADLTQRILRPVQPQMLDLPLTIAEKRVKDVLDRSPHDNTVADLVRIFSKVPYGWSDLATIDVLNELVRRHLYALSYNNNPDVSREEIARNIVRDAARFTIEPAKAISQEVLNAFVESWKQIFNVMTVVGSNDSAELYHKCKEDNHSALNEQLQAYRKLSRILGEKPFAPVVDEAIKLLESWLAIRDQQKFFETIIAAREHASALMDRCKSIVTFYNDQKDNYLSLYHFLDENRDNFAFLAPELQSSVESLKQVKSDEEPWKSLQSYLKIMRTLRGQLAERKQQLVEEIRKNYGRVFNELEAYATKMGVVRSAFADRDRTIAQKVDSNNFYALQLAADTSKFYASQMEKISAAIPQKPIEKGSNRYPVASTGGTFVSEPDPGTRPRPVPLKVVHLSVHSSRPICSEDDIDHYLQDLKQQLLKELNTNKGKGIIIN